MKSWVKFGLIWGMLMFLVINVLFPLWDNEKLSSAKIAVGIPVWLVFGLIFGYVSRKKEHKKQSEL